MQPGTAEESRVVIYLIEPEAGSALLRFVGTAVGMEARIGDVKLMSQLVEIGERP